MRIIITTILFLIATISNAQIIARRALENSILAPPGGNPTAPAASYIFALSDAITISWTASTDADGIRLYEIYLGGVFNTTVPTTPLTYTIFGLTQNTPYVITVRAVDNAGNRSAPSNALARSTLILRGPTSLNGNNAVLATFLSLTISGYDFRGGSDNLLTIANCNGVTIQNCVFFNTLNNAIEVNFGSNYTITNNLFGNASSGIYVVQTTGGMNVNNNQVLNIHGPFPRGQITQFNTCTGTNNIINANRALNVFAESCPQDLINVYTSSGTVGSPITVTNNITVGGGPSASGGGIIGGDQQGGHVLITGNKAVSPGQYGFGAAGGTDITLTNNQVFSPLLAWNNVGFFVLNFNDPAPCNDIYLDNTNKTNYMSRLGFLNPYYDAGNCGTVQPPGEGPSTGQTLASMNIPDPLITFVDEHYLWTLRSTTTYQSNIVTYGMSGGSGAPFSPGIDLNRPNVNAGSTQTITGSTATLSGSGTAVSGSFGTNGSLTYTWAQTKGPNIATMSNANAATNNLSGLVSGVYVFRLVVRQTNVQHGYFTYKSATVTINVN